MTWQAELFAELTLRLPTSVTAEVTGSAATPSELDGWSDLDLRLELTAVSEPVELLANLPVWAFSDVRSEQQQVLRLVLRDGRRLDLTVDGGLLTVPPPAVDNDVRFLAALAAAKLGRGDRLIGLHLTLEVLRSALVQAMLLRDRECGTSVHRFGSERDALADEITALTAGRLDVTPRPNLVERAVETYGRWRHELDPGYQPDWTGLTAVLDRGLGSDAGSGTGPRQEQSGEAAVSVRDRPV